MKLRLSTFLNFFALLFILSLFSCGGKPTKVLVFSKTEGFRHKSIETGVAAIKQLGKENNFQVDHTEDAAAFREENIKQYDAVIFLSTTGDVLDYIQQAEFERYIQAGGGYVGVHAASDTEYDWPWYGKLVGAYFKSHPKIQEAAIQMVDNNHISTKMLPDVWKRSDEWYNYKSINPNIRILLNLDETSYEGGENGKNHPTAWYHEYDGGRAFYTGGGHTKEAYAEPLFMQHLLGGIKYAFGKKKRNYALAKSPRVPPENRFVKTVLAFDLNEPMEMDIFDDGSLIIVERKGAIKLYQSDKEQLDSIGHIPVYSDEEDGLLGLAIDPNYEQNHWVYFCYSPVGDIPQQYISRFKFENKKLDMASEQVILTIPTQRDECCHSGGSIEFDSAGNLWIAIGDNTNPFKIGGTAPIDERKGREPWDAQRSASNTNDLRGKILRITVQADGTYTIPKGNLFPEGTAKTRPEIYVMGCRNPFRFTIDSRNGFLYWGDVGPDAGVDDEMRGPKGYDEVNQARKAGYYGWPYFRGKDAVYVDYNFASKKSSEKFNPKNPINDSPNNTGLTNLPPFQSSMIWYSYDKSEKFPWTKVGGKNPMAGPVYHSEDYTGENKYPEYFDNKLIIYEWMRNWLYLVKFDSLGNMTGVDPFLQTTEFDRPMDMLFSKEGVLYTLEYGTNWFARNMDARLSRIDYIKGNRKPIAKIKVDKIIGAAPLSVNFDGSSSLDYDEDDLQYEWTFTEGKKSTDISPNYSFDKPGIYIVKLKVIDASGEYSEASQEIKVGNEPPVIAWQIEGNQSFYWDKRSINYTVNVNDKEDGQSQNGTIDNNKITISIDYLDEGQDISKIAQGHLAALNASLGKTLGEQLISKSDCKTCHAIDKKINGPSYQDIANKYKNNKNANNVLSNRIIKGGSGVWGETAMIAHPQISKTDANEIVKYILSTTSENLDEAKLPTQGIYQLKDHLIKEEKGTYLFMASYTDNGGGEIEPITSRQEIMLRNPTVKAGFFDESAGEISAIGDFVSILKHGAYVGFKSLDFTDIEQLNIGYGPCTGDNTGGTVEIYLDDLNGEKIAEGTINSLKGTNKESDKATIELPTIKGKHNVYFVFKTDSKQDALLTNFRWIYFKNKKVEMF